MFAVTLNVQWQLDYSENGASLNYIKSTINPCLFLPFHANEEDNKCLRNNKILIRPVNWLKSSNL